MGVEVDRSGRLDRSDNGRWRRIRRIEETQPQNLEQEKVRHTPAEVVRSLIDILGQKVFEKVLRQIHENPFLTHIYIIGLPGSGKSTIVEGLLNLLMETFDITEDSFDPKTVAYFNSLPDEEQTSEQTLLSPLRKREFHESLASLKPRTLTPDEIRLAKSEEVTLTEKRNIVICELPAVGSQNLGQLLIGEVAAEERLTGVVQAMFIHILGDPEVKRKAIKVRRFAQNHPELDDYQLKTIFLKRNITDLYGEAVNSDKGKFELGQHLRHSATKTQIDRIFKEFRRKRIRREKNILPFLKHVRNDNQNTLSTDQNNDFLMYATINALLDNLPEWIKPPKGRRSKKDEDKWKDQIARDILYVAQRFRDSTEFVFPEFAEELLKQLNHIDVKLQEKITLKEVAPKRKKMLEEEALLRKKLLIRKFMQKKVPGGFSHAQLSRFVVAFNQSIK